MFSEIYDRYFDHNLVPLIAMYIGIIGIYVIIPESVGFARAIVSKLSVGLMLFILAVAAGKLRD